MNLELAAFELLCLGGGDSRFEVLDVKEGELREIQLQIDLVEVDSDCGLGRSVYFDLCAVVDDCRIEGFFLGFCLFFSLELLGFGQGVVDVKE